MFVSPARSVEPVVADPARGLKDGTIELEVVLAVVADLQVEADTDGRYRASFVLEGHLPATQLSDHGVTVVPLEALRISDLAVSSHVVERLGSWEDREAGVTGRVHFDRRAIDHYRGRGPLRTLALSDEHGDEIVLRRACEGSGAS